MSSETCPYCGTEVRVDHRLQYDQRAKMRCPNCGGTFEVVEGFGTFSLPEEQRGTRGTTRSHGTWPSEPAREIPPTRSWEGSDAFDDPLLRPDEDKGPGCGTACGAICTLCCLLNILMFFLVFMFPFF